MPKAPTKARAVPMEIPFPVKGIDQSQPRTRQPGATCIRSRNVRSFPPLSDRSGGGKRCGTRRAFTTQMTGTGSNRIIGLHVYTGAATAAAAPAGSDFLRPTGNVGTSGIGLWTNVGSNFFDDLDEVTANGATDYIHYVSLAADDPTGTTITFELTNHATPVAGSVVTMRWNFRTNRTAGGGTVSEGGTIGDRDGGEGPGGGGSGDAYEPFVGDGTETLIFDLLEGSTVIATSGNVSAESAGDWTPGSHVLTAAEIAAVTVWNDLRVRVRAGVTGSQVLTTFDVTWFCVEIAEEPDSVEGLVTEVLALLPDKCYVGILDNDDISPSETTGMDAAVPSIVNFRGQTAETVDPWWYVVDGEESIRILSAGGAVAPTVEDWKTESDTAYPSGNTFPEDCRLIERFRNAIWLARQEGSEPNEAAIYKGTNGDPLDWRFGVDDEDQPAELSAIALASNRYLGGAPQPVTCLAAWGDDFMLIGLARGILRVTGDIGLGGSVDVVTSGVGVQGSRAWCFDDIGNFWFMSGGSLFVLEVGTNNIRNISGRRLTRDMDRIDGSALLIMLCYDSFEKVIRIFMTPSISPQAGQIVNQKFPCFQNGYAVSFVYDILNDAFQMDDWPWDPMGPWSVCQISGDSDDNRRCLFGGNDGWIRRPYDGGPVKPPVGVDACFGTADDMPHNGTPTTPGSGGANYPITSGFTSAAIEAKDGASELIVTEIQAIGADNNGPLGIPVGPVTWRWLVADTPDRVVQATSTNARASGTWFEDDEYGLQPPVCVRIAGGAHAIDIEQAANSTEGWALTRIVAWIRPGARRRV